MQEQQGQERVQVLAQQAHAPLMDSGFGTVCTQEYPACCEACRQDTPTCLLERDEDACHHQTHQQSEQQDEAAQAMGVAVAWAAAASVASCVLLLLDLGCLARVLLRGQPEQPHIMK